MFGGPEFDLAPGDGPSGEAGGKGPDFWHAFEDGTERGDWR
jgi:hypothetical protein